MKLLRYIALVLCFGVLAPMQQAYAGSPKAGSIFPAGLSVERVAAMLYEAAKKDPENAPLLLMDAINSRASWTVSELQLVTEALLLAVPSLTVGDLISIFGNTSVPENVVQGVVEQIKRNDGASPNHLIEALPPLTPMFPLIPTPGPVSGMK